MVSLSQAQNSDESFYSCSAVWNEEEETSNEIDLRVMGTFLTTCETFFLHFCLHCFIDELPTHLIQLIYS